ncbi:hypothetical protein [Burkholderia stabilis]|uniref:hypothetical protein n=1 Tax=Burkholderia stabilis TaxID=95485 RepID=UPI001F4BA038|nr:hypothetical protein [Burkholderia stabilis]
MNESLNFDRQNLVVNPLRRPVNIQSGSRSSRMRTECNVQGALCLNRARSMGGGNSKLLRLFLLPQPAKFASTFDAKDIVAYGLGVHILRVFQDDDEFRTAVLTLLAKGYRLSLGERRLDLNVAGKIPNNLRESLSDSLAIAAGRLEALTGGVVNSEASLSRIRKPWIVASILSGIFYFFRHLVSGLPLSAFSLLPAIVVGTVVLSTGVIFVLRASLKQYALAGAVASEALMWSVFSSVFFSIAICPILNDYVGERVLPAQSLVVDGTVHIAHGKYTSCSLVLNTSTPVVLDGKRLQALPMLCSLAYLHNDSSEYRYEVKINRGLLGAAFVQSFSLQE